MFHVDPPPQQDKVHWRRTLRQRRAALQPQQRHAAARQIAAWARAAGLLRRGRRLAAYVPTGSECSTWPLMLAAQHSGCRVYLPIVPRRGRKLSFVRFDEHAVWQLGAYNIPEPRHAEHCKARALDVVFIPLVGVDRQLRRLGQGGGYYDTTFHFRRTRRHWRRPLLVGIAFDCQRVDTLPADRWDLGLDLLITESGLHRRPI
ncbi:5-formyltetrahydrofolate cyclo-ligase [Jeongeupia wiesaeckerbachi]|uniref:5-formyltetrahydrofolate cyclo-ligase n=1 Tax=Jeongeupia wiesaeckerbachi TaxID=3051218 RepID=UPI003D80A182